MPVDQPPPKPREGTRGSVSAIRERLSRLRALAEQRGAEEECALVDEALAALDAMPRPEDATTLTSALRDPRGSIRSVLASLPIVLWSITKDGTVTLSEGAGLAGLGLKPGQIVGQNVFDLYQDAPEAMSYIKQALTGESLTREAEAANIHWRNGYFPIFDGEGEVIGVTGFSLDVTETKRMEEESRRIEERMRHAQKLESLGVLAGGIAHDFNNLLVGVLANAGVVAKHLADDSPARARVRDIQSAAQRAAELTNQMLAYAGKGRFAIEPLDLSVVVAEMAQLLDAVLSKKAHVRTHYDEGLPHVDGDAAQIRQVVMNLLTNASDALGDDEGSITVTTKSIAADRDYLSACDPGRDLAEGEYVAVEVRDTGAGMSPETRDKIFDPFYTTKTDGRGLGLAAVIGIVRSHGGAMRIDSEPGAGSTFTVLLPPSQNCPARTRADSGDPASFTGRGTILVVDDEPAVRDVLVAILEDAGFDVMAASSGRAALELYAERPDDIVLALVDMTMPEMGGEDTFRALRDAGGDLPIVLMSGHEDQVTLDRLIQSGPASFLPKPFSLDGLLARVAETLDGVEPAKPA